ncbi:hypothetical protein [Bartonella sp. HY406]|uniref:hypothetical protein n=1 Tax=Bartonella sp. HY406 TaxID=2979331 RepID=UPI0021C6FAE3|nr:hypothetical protein [Bartonella sp. HY406]UXN04981.1 hypothetical protein N6B01_13980 [Bartonella sp. HY406]
MNEKQVTTKKNIFIWIAIIIDCLAIVKFMLSFASMTFFTKYIGEDLTYSIFDFLIFVDSLSLIFNVPVLIILGAIFWGMGLQSGRFSDQRTDLIVSIIKIHLVILFFVAMLLLSIWISKL